MDILNGIEEETIKFSIYKYNWTKSTGQDKHLPKAYILRMNGIYDGNTRECNKANL